MDVPRARRSRKIVHGTQVRGIARVDDTEAFREHVSHIGMAAMHHDLHAVGPAALVAMADDAQIARIVGFWQVGHAGSKKFGTAIQSMMARGFCRSACILRSSAVLRSTPRWVPSLRPWSMMRSPISWRTEL